MRGPAGRRADPQGTGCPPGYGAACGRLPTWLKPDLQRPLQYIVVNGVVRLSTGGANGRGRRNGPCSGRVGTQVAAGAEPAAQPAEEARR